MNRVFKNKWSAAHQQYVVTDEHRSTKGKASKSAVALAVAAVAMMAAGGRVRGVHRPGLRGDLLAGLRSRQGLVGDG